MDSITVSHIWEQYNHALKKFIQKKIGNEQDAEDVFQEAFLKIHLSINGIKDVTRIESWVYRIVRNTIADYYRKKVNQIDFQDLTDDLTDSDGEDLYFNTEINSCLKSMVTMLPIKYKEAIVMTEIEAKPQKKLSEATGLSLTGAKSRVQRAKSLLRRSLLNCCHVITDRRGNITDYSLKGKSCTYC